MPSFLYPLPIAIVAGLVALPILIHLINLMRHRRVQWAAMEFLLASQKRNSTWVLLKQLLLLLLRIAAITAAVLMVTQPIVQNSLGGLFGGTKLHHIVLLDDSFSMSDHWADTTAFDEAKRLIQRLGTQAAQQPSRQQFTLLRFSQAGRTDRGTQSDLAAVTVDAGEFPRKLDETLQRLHVSQLAVGPDEALQTAAQLIGSGADAKHLVFLVSDYRAKEWAHAAGLKKHLQRLNDADVRPQLINCVDDARPNLAITALRPAQGTRAAGVPLAVELTVRNFSAAPATKVSVRLDEQGSSRPAVEFEKIEPGRSMTRQFEVRATAPGQRRISAFLPADAVMLDNARYTVLDFPSGVPVLIIDGGLKSGDVRAGDGYFLQSALVQPGPVPTGLRPRVEAPRFLDDHALEEFHAIYLCNVDRLPLDAVSKLTEYVEGGGGVAFFVGDRSRADFFNQMYADGEGLFPVPLEAPVPLLVDQQQKTPDMLISDHPIFRIFSGDNNPFIKMVNIGKYFAVKRGWKPAEGSSTAVIAKARNGAPLVIEKKLGEGRVVAFLTSAAPNWNNWARDNPSYVVTILELQGYLAAGRQTDPSHQVGAPLEIPVDLKTYQPLVEFLTPQEGNADKIVVKAEPQGDGPARAVLNTTDTSGVYEVQLTAVENATPEVRGVAFNVDAAEGDLKNVGREQLAAELGDVTYDYHRAGDLYFDSKEMQGDNLSEAVLYLLIFLLVAEQLLAYAVSYHPARLQGAQ